jgi:pseudaminic acid cytidylyltransferase
MNIYGVIPIRSGSKRFPGKNIYNIAGVPLFSFASSIAESSGVFSKIIISSDSDEYLGIAKSLNFCIHSRSAESSSDRSKTEDVILEVISSFRLDSEDWIFLIQATNPFQRAEYFINAKDLIGTGIASVVTYRSFKRFFIEDVLAGDRPRTQDLPKRRLETGLFWAFNIGEFVKTKCRIIKPCSFVEVSEFDDVDIDYFEDLEPHLPRLEQIAKNELIFKNN